MTDVNLKRIGEAARAASRELARAEPARIDRALGRIADALSERGQDILAANARDVARARSGDLGEHIVDRLVLDEARLGLASAITRSLFFRLSSKCK